MHNRLIRGQSDNSQLPDRLNLTTSQLTRFLIYPSYAFLNGRVLGREINQSDVAVRVVRPTFAYIVYKYRLGIVLVRRVLILQANRDEELV